jgi:reactive intermediate/imine deaminase
LLAEANVVEGQCAVPCWQTVQFYPAVEIEANTTYIASYFASAGRYAIDYDYFATSGVTNGPLTALKSVTDDGNGVYAYGQAGEFPVSTWRASNYWVDVVFEPGDPVVTTGLEVIYTPDAPSAPMYSQGIAYGDFLFVSGQLPKYPNGTNETGPFATQARRVLDNIGAILTAAGLTFCDVAKVNVLLTNVSDLAEFNTIYVPYFAGCQTADGTPVIPARESMGGIELSGSPDFKLEVSAVACR